MLRPVAIGALVLVSSVPDGASAQNIARQLLNPELSFAANALQGPSRKIMRLSDGKIYVSLLANPEAGSQVKLFAASDRKPGFDDVSARELAAVKAKSVNSDTGPTGTYVSPLNGNTQSGEILLYPDPVGTPGRVVRFSSLTRSSEQIADGYIAASKGDESINSVAYGWRDLDKNALLIGYSPDGRQFSETRSVVADPYLQSGPLIAIHNKYVLVSYLSADPRYRPNATFEAGGAKNPAYQVFVESWDGAQTWSAPRPVLGVEPVDFPKVDFAQIGAKATEVNGNLFAIGGSRQPSNVLAWAQAGIGARIFILSEQRVISSDPKIDAGLQANPVTVPVLAFKDLSDGPQAPWNTVIASVPPATQRLGEVPGAFDFQYSALPGTSIRAVAYRRSPPRQPSRNSEGVVVSVSINTGQSFDRAVFIPKEKLGLADKDPLIFTSSTCVHKNEKGDLFLDVAYLDGGNKVQSAQLPLDFNLSQLPPSMFNIVAKWP